MYYFNLKSRRWVTQTGAPAMPPVMVYGAQVSLAVAVGEMSNGAFVGADLSAAASWRAAVDVDLLESTGVMARSENGAIDSTMAQNGKLVVAVNTVTTRWHDVTDGMPPRPAIAELRGFNSSGDCIYVVQLPVVVAAGIDPDGRAPIPVRDNAPEFQYSADGESWHSLLADNDTYQRVRIGSTGEWSAAQTIPRGPQGAQGLQGIQGPVGPQGPQGEAGISSWGGITGDISDQSDMQRYLRALYDVNAPARIAYISPEFSDATQYTKTYDAKPAGYKGINAFPTISDAKQAIAPESVVYVGGTHSGVQSLDGASGVVVGESNVFDDNIYGCNGDQNDTVSGIGNVTIHGGAMQRVFGGNRIAAEDASVIELEGQADVIISGGTFAGIVGGGDYIDSGSLQRTGDINLTISGGVFAKIVAGAETLNCTSTDPLSASYSVTHYGNVSLVIKGGTIKKSIFCGMMTGLKAYSAQTNIVGNVSVTIDTSVSALAISSTSYYVVLGSSGYGTVDGDVSLTFTGTHNFTFTGTILGASESAYRNTQTNELVTYVSGDRRLVFSCFNAQCKPKFYYFSHVEVRDHSAVSVATGSFPSPYPTYWLFEYGSSLSGIKTLSWAGANIVFDVTGWPEDVAEWVPYTGTATSALNDFSSAAVSFVADGEPVLGYVAATRGNSIVVTKDS